MDRADENARDGVIARLFEDIGKYAVSHSGDVDTSWQGSVLLRDITDVKRLRQEDSPNLEHFPTKWKPVRRRKCDKIKNLERVPIALDRNAL